MIFLVNPRWPLKVKIFKIVQILSRLDPNDSKIVHEYNGVIYFLIGLQIAEKLRKNGKLTRTVGRYYGKIRVLKK